MDEWMPGHQQLVEFPTDGVDKAGEIEERGQKKMSRVKRKEQAP